MITNIEGLRHHPKLITCIVPRGHGLDLVDALFHELGINTANVAGGRGASQRSGNFADEMSIVTVTVEADRADEVFEFLYEKAQIGSQRHRFMYQSGLEVTNLFTLPEVEEEED